MRRCYFLYVSPPIEFCYLTNINMNKNKINITAALHMRIIVFEWVQSVEFVNYNTLQGRTNDLNGIYVSSIKTPTIVQDVSFSYPGMLYIPRVSALMWQQEQQLFFPFFVNIFVRRFPANACGCVVFVFVAVVIVMDTCRNSSLYSSLENNTIELSSLMEEKHKNSSRQ